MTKAFARAIGTGAIVAAVLTTGFLINTQRARAEDGEDDIDQSKVRIGLAITPVQLKFAGKNRSLLGLGSYIVNAQGDCNGCHSLDPAKEFLPGGNPYFGQHPTKVNPKTFLGGGRNFGALIPGSAEIISRNLTPDKSGRPEGGNSLTEFMHIIRTGTDMDKWHPTCKGAPGPHCVPAPFDGSLLQIMPWPIYANMTDLDLRAIYEYLSAIPCIEGDPGNPAGADTKGHRCK